MSIVIQSTQTEITTTAQNIMDDVAQDIRQQLQSTAGTSSAAILLDYVNRTQQEILGSSPLWPFMVSPVKRFVTELGQSDYWVGAAGQAPYGVVDTRMGLTDMWRIEENSVYDRSNFKQLLPTSVEPLNINMQFRDTQGRPGKPGQYRQDYRNTPYIISLFPPPNNQNNYSMVPESALATVGPLGGSLPATTYYIRVSYVDNSGGESIVSTPSSSVFVPAGYLLTVQPPQIPFIVLDNNSQIVQWNCYIGTTQGSETLQNTGPLYLTQTFVLPTSGLIAGASQPGTSTLQQLQGYIIEFQYHRARIQLTVPGQYIQIPDEYKEVLIAGTNMRAARFLKHSEDQQFWMKVYDEGLRRMIRDKNRFRRGFLRPDPGAVGFRLPGIESLDPSLTS